ncbi:hypothetical protein [Aestuariimicrobium sp. T2.26MG-19.2B]|nr:hypothetical protein [Aestuariimicrobium sp. T2.26MG-19.2B]CAI9400410.1 hypothetical protein AESSP_00382 [Aestuariimicrobium sp. T2.26MG-19.2B]
MTAHAQALVSTGPDNLMHCQQGGNTLAHLLKINRPTVEAVR